MSTHDDDILDFDFLDEGATSETQSRDPRPTDRRSSGGGRGGSGGGPRGGRGGGTGRQLLRGAGGFTPLLRLVGLIAFAILLVVLLVVWAQGCSNNHQRGAYQSYMRDMGTVGAGSAKIGGQLAELLTTPGKKEADMVSGLGGLIDNEKQVVAQAQQLHPPGPVRAEHDHAVEALQFRVSGMQGLRRAFEATAKSSDSVAAGQLLSSQAQRLLASDVIWSDLFKAPAEKELKARSVSGVLVPGSVFATSTDLFTAKSMTLVSQRVHGASIGAPSGLHGTNLGSVTVVPSGQVLGAAETTIKSSASLGFDVAVHNGGSSQEVQVQVTLTIPASPTQIVKTATIAVIDPNDTKTVRFKDFPTIPIGSKTTVKVDVKPVKGELRIDNNSAEFPIIVSLV
ncbi:MAG: CARDB domain-containing protein [Gaiellaceae bacterium]